jgi:antitoxin HicB
VVEKNLEYYKNLPYTIVLEQHNDQRTYWVARVAELPHCLIHANSPEEALSEIEVVKSEWIQSNLEEHLPIPEPVERKYSGEIRVRMPPSLHRTLADRAELEGVSLNQYMVAALAQAAGLKKDKQSEAACA